MKTPGWHRNTLRTPAGSLMPEPPSLAGIPVITMALPGAYIPGQLLGERLSRPPP